MDETEISSKRYEIHTPVVTDLLNEAEILGKKRKFQILCEGIKPYYWKLFSIDADCSVQDLLQYIREWVECKCPSHVETYTLAPKGILSEILNVRNTYKYIYDKYGTPTAVTIHVLEERDETQFEAEARTQDGQVAEIMLLAQNELPFPNCFVCGDEATSYCTQCLQESEGNIAEAFYCDVCATDEDHDCPTFDLDDDNHRLDIDYIRDYVNSPRFGLCQRLEYEEEYPDD